jgi:hypothetical protein
VRSHRLAVLVGVCFVVAAVAMLSVRPGGGGRSGRPVGVGPSGRGHLVMRRPR